jgi:nucleotide-binding universal stress UspA family protein
MAYRRVVVGTDGSETAAVAVQQAADMAVAFNAELLIVTAFETNPADSDRSESVPDELQWQITDSGVAEGHALAASRLAVGRGMKAKKVHSISERGEPAEALITVAEERGGDLIVVGSKGMSSASRFLLGNVPNKVSHHAPCDVIIVHTTD